MSSMGSGVELDWVSRVKVRIVSIPAV